MNRSEALFWRWIDEKFEVEHDKLRLKYRLKSDSNDFCLTCIVDEICLQIYVTPKEGCALAQFDPGVKTERIIWPWYYLEQQGFSFLINEIQKKIYLQNETKSKGKIFFKKKRSSNRNPKENLSSK